MQIYQLKAYILPLAVSKLLQIICQICLYTSHINTLARSEPLNSQALNSAPGTPLYRAVQNVFRLSIS